MYMPVDSFFSFLESLLLLLLLLLVLVLLPFGLLLADFVNIADMITIMLKLLMLIKIMAEVSSHQLVDILICNKESRVRVW